MVKLPVASLLTYLEPTICLRHSEEIANLDWHTRGSYIGQLRTGAFSRRMRARMDDPRANTAVAHKLARMIYFMLTRGEGYVDQGQQHYEAQQRERSGAA